jgi:hypothetical protein
MKKINKNSKRGIVNLFADFILTKIDKNENTIIQITDCESFMVVHGQTTSKKILDLEDVKSEFYNLFKDELKSIGIEKINTIDVIRYDQEINNIEKGWITVNKNIFTDDVDPIHELSITSEFPYGYSLNCGRLMVYYSHYIFNHLYSLLNSDEVQFYFTKETDDSEDFKIKIICDTKQNLKDITSLILDVFSFDLKDFKDKINDYNVLEDILNPVKDKPYTKQDLLEHIILF